MAPAPFLTKLETAAFLEIFKPLSHLLPPISLAKRMNRAKAIELLKNLEVALNTERREAQIQLDAALENLEKAKQHYYRTVANAERRLKQTQEAAGKHFDLNCTEEESIYNSSVALDNELACKIKQVVEIKEAL